MVITDDIREELSLRFKALLGYENANDLHKNEVKENNKSAHETIKALANKMEVKQKSIKKAFKEYKESIMNKEEYEETGEVFATIKEFNLLDQEEKKD